MALRDKFPPPPELYDVLEGISMKDVTLLYEKDLVDAVTNPLHTLQMKLYCRKNLSRFFRTNDDYDDENDCDVEPANTDSVLSLNLKSSICKESLSNGDISLKDVVSYIENTVPNITLIKYLKFQNKYSIYDVDLKYIIEAVKMLPNLEILDLSSTRIKGECSDFIKNILNKGITVDITVTSMASIECRSFFDSLTPSQHEKLIWIAEYWLYREGWTKIFTSADAKRNELIKETHAKYFLAKKDQ